MSGRLGLVFVTSVGVTAGTGYFLLSDGGDSDVAVARVDDALVRAREEMDSLPSVVSGVVSSATGSSSAPANSKEELPSASNQLEAAEARSEVVASPKPGSGRRSRREVESPFPPRAEVSEDVCHMCSGPRLWFYADKLGATRLKRRFTPHPDP